MARTYRKRAKSAGHDGADVVDKGDVLAGRVSVELPVSLAEVIEGVSEEIERLTGEAGLLILKAVMDAEVESRAGPKGKHDPERTATRWSRQPGYVVPAGKKVNRVKPRVRDLGGHARSLRSYRRFPSPPRRQRSIVKRLIHGISTHKSEPAIDDFTDGYGISRSAVSRERIQATRGSLPVLGPRRIDEWGRLAVLRIDGKEIEGPCVVVALGVDSTGEKHLLGWMQGRTENSAGVQHRLEDRIERGLDATPRMLIVLEGSKALRKEASNTGDWPAFRMCKPARRSGWRAGVDGPHARSLSDVVG